MIIRRLIDRVVIPQVRERRNQMWFRVGKYLRVGSQHTLKKCGSAARRRDYKHQRFLHGKRMVASEQSSVEPDFCFWVLPW